MVDVSNPDALRNALLDLNTRLQTQQLQMTTLQNENAQLQARLAQATPAPVTPPAPARTLVDTRVIGKPDAFNGEGHKFPDWAFKLKAYMGAVDPRYQQSMAAAEASGTALLNDTMESHDAATASSSSQQLYSYDPITKKRSKLQNV